MSDPNVPTRPDIRPDIRPVQDIALDPLPPPIWVVRSIPEDGGVTHERPGCRQPLAHRWHHNGTTLYPTEVSLSVIDMPTDGRWTRTAPTIQVEGGSYPPEGARHLRDALIELLSHVDTDPA